MTRGIERGWLDLTGTQTGTRAAPRLPLRFEINVSYANTTVPTIESRLGIFPTIKVPGLTEARPARLVTSAWHICDSDDTACLRLVSFVQGLLA